MSHIYTHQRTNVSLYEDTYNDQTPYVITIGKVPVIRCDELSRAYQEYNNLIVQQQRKKL